MSLMIKKVLQDLEINLLNSGIGLRSEKLKRTPDAKLKKRTVSTAKKTPSKRDSTHAERRESVFNLIRPWGMLLPDEFMHMVASLSEDQKSEILDTLIHIEDKDFSHLSGALEDSLLSNASTVMMPSENLPTQGQCIGEEERKRDSIIMSEFQILGARFLKVLRESGSPIISAPRPNSNSEELQPEINSMPSAETPCGANNEESGIEMPVVFKPSKTLLRTPPQSALKPPLELATSPSTDEDKTAVIETTPSLQPQGGPLGLLSATKSGNTNQLKLEHTDKII